MMDKIDEILTGPEYFYCEKGKCKLRLEICISRQKGDKEKGWREPLPFLMCEKCEQGAENRRSYKPGQAMKGNPKKGKGARNGRCEIHSDCLDIAAKKDWKTFNCESCVHYGEGNKVMTTKTAQKETTRLCQDCGEKPTLSSNCPYCASCMAKRANKKKASGQPKKKKIDQQRHKVEKPSPRAETALTIEFGKYASILEEVEKLAEDQMRPIDLQVIYILKTHLNSIQDVQTAKISSSGD